MRPIITFAIALAITYTAGAVAQGWEGDDGGLDQFEVSLGRWSDAVVAAEAEREHNQMQLTVPPAPPPLAPPAFSGANDGRRCYGAEPLLAWYSPGWDVRRMAGIMWRESNCQPNAYNRSGASGLLQVLASHCRWLSSRVGPCDLFDPDYNIRAAAAIWREQGYGAWSTS